MPQLDSYLDDSLSASDFEDLTLSRLAISELDVDDLSVSGHSKEK